MKESALFDVVFFSVVTIYFVDDFRFFLLLLLPSVCIGLIVVTVGFFTTHIAKGFISLVPSIQ